MIDEAEALLLRASALGAIGRYQLEGALQSAHVDRRRTGRVGLARGRADLRRAARAVGLAGRRDQSRARARARSTGARGARGARRGRGGRAARGVPAVLGGARGAARECRRARRGARRYDIAIGLERDPAVRKFLQERQASLADSTMRCARCRAEVRALGVSRGRRRTGMCAAEPQGWCLGVPREMPIARAPRTSRVRDAHERRYGRTRTYFVSLRGRGSPA